MSENRALKRFGINIRHRFAGDEVKSVKVLRVLFYRNVAFGFIEYDDGFEQLSLALLNILTERMKVGRVNGGSRENTLVILTLALAEKLF